MNYKMRDIKFSIVIPAYNAEKFIETALKSVVDQSYKNFEIIIIDNGSIDGTKNIIDKIISNNTNISIKLIILNPNKGISKARNIGILNSTGDYISFLDADDVWYKNKLEKVKNVIDDNPEVDVIWHWENHVSSTFRKEVKYKSINNEKPYEDLLFNNNRLSTSATSVRRASINNIGGFSPKYIAGEEDYDCWLRLAREKSKFYLIKEALGEFRIYDGSTSSKVLKHNSAVLNMLKEHMEYLEKDRSYSKRYLTKIFTSKNAQITCSNGRWLSMQNEKSKSLKEYRKCIKLRPFWWKPYAGIVLLILNK